MNVCFFKAEVIVYINTFTLVSYFVRLDKNLGVTLVFVFLPQSKFK